jgi:hypothetical protein
MDIGIEIRASEDRALLLDDAQGVVGPAYSALPLSRPQPLWDDVRPTCLRQCDRAPAPQMRAA